MNFWRVLSEGTATLAAHRLRTFFMMLGTILGIASLTVVLAIGEATRREVLQRIDAFGTRLIKVNAGGGKGYTKPQAGVVTLKLHDAEAIRSSITGWDIVTSVSQRHGIAMKAGDRQTTGDVFAVDSDWHEAMDWPARVGDGIAPEDLATMGRVCVLGTRLAKALFGDEDPVGREMYIGTIRFHIKDLLIHKASSPGGDDENNRAVVPLTTGLRRVFNQDHLSYIRVRMRNPRDVPGTSQEIRRLLHERHHITPPQTDDFNVVTAAEVAQAARGVSGTLTALLFALVALSLLVGGVVMMNILLISVAERKQEIGLRRALGATGGAIAWQFLGESLAVTLVGAALGAAIGWGASAMLPRFTSLKTSLSWEPFALAAVFALVVGLIFGVHPARRAARLSPVEALR